MSPWWKLSLRVSSRLTRTDALRRALKAGDFDQATWIAQVGGIDASDPEIFIQAIQGGPASLVQSILRAGADPNRRHGRLHPLQIARDSAVEPFEKIRTLFLAGSNPDSKTGPCRWPILRVATFLGDAQLARSLIELGADPVWANGPEPSLQEIEEQFILGDGLQSQVHETVKTAVRFAGCELARFGIRRAENGPKPVFRYSVTTGATDRYRIEIPFLETGSIGAAIFLEADVPEARSEWLILDFLSNSDRGGISLQSLRARIHLTLEKLRKGEPIDSDERGTPKTENPAETGPLPRAVLSAMGVLGVAPTTPETEILAAYRRLAKQYHPDLGPGASESERAIRTRKMSEINEAYRLLRSLTPF